MRNTVCVIQLLAIHPKDLDGLLLMSDCDSFPNLIKYSYSVLMYDLNTFEAFDGNLILDQVFLNLLWRVASGGLTGRRWVQGHMRASKPENLTGRRDDDRYRSEEPDKKIRKLKSR